MKSGEICKLPLDDIPQTEAASRTLCAAAERDPSVWVLTADVMRSTRTKPFSTTFPDRFVNVGIAEQSMVGIAAGLATCGKVPVATAFAAMLSMRACEQIRTDVAYPNLNVKIIACSAGLSFGYSGATHHAIEDIAILRAMANMAVIVPCDARETQEAVHAALNQSGPVYIRIGRTNERTVYPERLDYQIGRAVLIREGTDITLIGCGRTTADCVLAGDLLLNEGVKARVLDMHTVKPIDRAAVEEAASQTRLILTVEEHNVIGGLGGAVAEILAELGCSTPLKRLGIPDAFPPIGSQEAILEMYGITASHITDVVLGRQSPSMHH